MPLQPARCLLFFFNDTAATAIHTLSLHDALPIFITFAFCPFESRPNNPSPSSSNWRNNCAARSTASDCRSEEHTSELQSPGHRVCRLLLQNKPTLLPLTTHCPSRLYPRSCTPPVP